MLSSWRISSCRTERCYRLQTLDKIAKWCRIHKHHICLMIGRICRKAGKEFKESAASLMNTADGGEAEQIIAVSLSSQATPFTLHSFIHCSFKHTECCSFKTCRWYPAEKSPITEAEKTSADWINQLWACDHVFAYSRAATISRWINHKKMNHWLFGNPIIATSIWFLVCWMRRRRLVGLWETERFINWFWK